MTDNLSNNPELFRADAPPEIAYERPPEIENQIKECLRFDEDELEARLKIGDFRAKDFIKAETAVCLLGMARAENLSHFENLFATKLAGVCEKLVRKFLRARGFGENFIEEAVGALVSHMFAQILQRREKSYDFWEVNFYVSLERLTKNYLRRMRTAGTEITDTFSDLSGVGDEGDFDFESNLPEYETLTIEEKLEIKEILAKMPAEHRMIFIRCNVDDWTQEQIAEFLGITARTVRTRLKNVGEFLKDFRAGESRGEK